MSAGRELNGASVEWVSRWGQKPFPSRTIGLELAELFKRTGIEIVEISGVRFIAKAPSACWPTVNI